MSYHAFCSAVLTVSVSIVAMSGAFAKDTQSSATKPSDMVGRVVVDGSSTVYPITEAVAEEFGNEYKKVKVTIGVSGTGGGFKKFVQGEVDINNASRPIKEKELLTAEKNGIKPIDLPVAYDGISVVVNPKNTWMDMLTAHELHKIWNANSSIMQWSDIRPDWPQRKIKLYGPGADSGTFDYFTEKVNGKSRVSRNDYTASEDDSVLVKGVAGDLDSLGYFGFAYYEENKTKLKVLKIQDGDKKAIAPNLESIADGSYYLSRPIYIYVSQKAAQTKPALRSFITFYLKNAQHLVKDVGYIPLSDNAYNRALSKFEQNVTSAALSTDKKQEALESSKSQNTDVDRKK